MENENTSTYLYLLFLHLQKEHDLFVPFICPQIKGAVCQCVNTIIQQLEVPVQKADLITTITHRYLANAEPCLKSREGTKLSCTWSCPGISRDFTITENTVTFFQMLILCCRFYFTNDLAFTIKTLTKCFLHILYLVVGIVVESLQSQRGCGGINVFFFIGVGVCVQFSSTSFDYV